MMRRRFSRVYLCMFPRLPCTVLRRWCLRAAFAAALLPSSLHAQTAPLSFIDVLEGPGPERIVTEYDAGSVAEMASGDLPPGYVELRAERVQLGTQTVVGLDLVLHGMQASTQMQGASDVQNVLVGEPEVRQLAHALRAGVTYTRGREPLPAPVKQRYLYWKGATGMVCQTGLVAGGTPVVQLTAPWSAVVLKLNEAQALELADKLDAALRIAHAGA